MKVAYSDISLASSHQYRKRVEESKDEEIKSTLQLGSQRDTALQALDTTAVEESEEYPLDSKLKSIILALEALTGEKIDISSFNRLNGESQSRPSTIIRSLEYSHRRAEISAHDLSFAAKGSVKSEDGRVVDFSLAFEMSRVSIKSESFKVHLLEKLKDPLVINYEGNELKISSVKHNFDLDLDGKEDSFHFVGEGSGFLALDKNSDGLINNGCELFGPNSGEGFKDLAYYDEDSNGWIDENDSIFKSLKIWTKDENSMNLYTLKQKGVGALYLEKNSSEFTLEVEGDRAAELRESSIFLSEDGGVGTLQEIDLLI